MKLIVFIPALNEQDTIGEALDRIPKSIDGIDEIIKLVIDDGSTDDTAKIAQEHGAIVLRNGRQKRLAYTFQRAVEWIVDNGGDIAVNIDADLQFDASEIPDLVAPIISGEADFVAADRFSDPKTGKRRRPENMPIGKYYSNRLGSWILGKLSGMNFPDVTCGFRAYSREALLKLNINSKYTYTQESFQALAMQNLNIKSVPVSIKYFPGRKSRVVTSFLGFLFGSAWNILKAFRDFAPMRFFGAIGITLFFFGLIADIFVLQYYIRNGAFSPYISVLFTGVYLNTLGIITLIVGLMADMLDRVRNNQNKILYHLKKQASERAK